jgi:hypothetical protein
VDVLFLGPRFYGIAPMLSRKSFQATT